MMESIELLTFPKMYFNANPTDLAIVRAHLVAEFGNEEGTRKLYDMTAEEVEAKAEKLIGNSCGCDDDGEIELLPPIGVARGT